MLTDPMETFNQNYDANFAKLRTLIETWVREIPHSEFIYFTSALNEYFENERSYTSRYAKRIFLSWLREAENCSHLQDLFSKLECHENALMCLLCSEMALDHRMLFYPLLLTLENNDSISDEDFEKISFVYRFPGDFKAEDLVSCDDSEPLKREKVLPERRFSDAEYNITSYSMVVPKEEPSL